MLNVSSETTRAGAGALIRAIEPTELPPDHAAESRHQAAARPGTRPRTIERAALRIDPQLDGIDLRQPGPLWLGSDAQVSGPIGQSKRIGLTQATDSPLRFFLRGNQFIRGLRAPPVLMDTDSFAPLAGHLPNPCVVPSPVS